MSGQTAISLRGLNWAKRRSWHYGWFNQGRRAGEYTRMAFIRMTQEHPLGDIGRGLRRTRARTAVVTHWSRSASAPQIDRILETGLFQQIVWFLFWELVNEMKLLRFRNFMGFHSWQKWNFVIKPNLEPFFRCYENLSDLPLVLFAQSIFYETIVRQLVFVRAE